MAERSIVIIGAGVGGLAAGCYAQMNGYDTRIYEQHAIPGGVCTGWTRKGYTFDGCMHHLAGCTPGTRLYRMWQELGAMPRVLRYPEDLICVEGIDSQRFTVHTDLDRLQEHMLDLAPNDATPIFQFIQAARRFARLNLMDMLLAKPWELLGMLPSMPFLGKWGKVTLEQYATRFSDSFLRRALPMIQYDIPDISPLVALMFVAGCSTGYLGWPVGGSLAFSHSLARRYRDLGGELQTRARVSEILVEPRSKGDRAVGIRLEDGTEHRADMIISNADGYTTIYGMLGGRYTNERIRAYYTTHAPDRQVMSLHVGLGVARDLTQEPHALVLWLPEPVEIAGELRDRLDLELFAFAPEMAPKGHTVVKAHFATRYDYWRALRDAGEAYAAEKQRAAETVIACLERRFPGFAAQVEVVDVATPLTTERYVGSYRGFQSWPVPDQGSFEALSGQGLSRTLPGLDGFYMVGQWAGGLGLPNVAAMGRKVVASICKRDGRRFVTQMPS
ncbi:MAG: NAD(P)/FAD-dependent oxidoreductase [Anaerolineae bacterium]|nr:NAD(P)/FAD-dependent oxidoreductase [Anaerolineae bacterium]